METLTVSLRLPRDLLAALDVPSAQLEPRLHELIALELFREGLISSGKGAELLDLSKIEFIQLLAQRGICYFTESPEELASDLHALEHLLDRAKHDCRSQCRPFNCSGQDRPIAPDSVSVRTYHPYPAGCCQKTRNH